MMIGAWTREATSAAAFEKQVSELVEIVARDISKHDIAADIGTRMKKLRAADARVQLAPSKAFNDNKTFLVWVNEEDQLRIISMQKGSDILAVFK